MSTPQANVVAHYIEQIVPLATSLRGKVVEGECARLLPVLAEGLENCLEEMGLLPPDVPGYEDDLPYLGAALWTDAGGRLAYGDDWLTWIRRIEETVRPLVVPVKGLEPGRPRRPRPGRPPEKVTDARLERRILEAWGTGHHPTYADVARAVGCDLDAVGAVMAREHQRRSRQRRRGRDRAADTA
jgi:hypothetical protein